MKEITPKVSCLLIRKSFGEQVRAGKDRRCGRMPFVLSKTVFKRLCLLPLLFIIIILFFYKQIINLYHGVEYNGNVTVAKSAFDLFKRQPVNICQHIDLLNVGSPDFVGDVGSAYYPQVVCTDPGFGYVIIYICFSLNQYRQEIECYLSICF